MNYNGISLAIIVASFLGIGASNISTASIVNGTIKLDKAGRYDVITSLKIEEQADEVPLIEITSSNIILDFHSNTVEGSLAKNNNIGIKIASGLSNIVIKNGTIKNCSGKGMDLGTSCFNITTKNFSLQNILSPSISVDNGGSIFFEGVNISTIRSETESANYVLDLFNTVGLYVYESVHSIENGCSLKDVKIDLLLLNNNSNKCAVIAAKDIKNLYFKNVFLVNFLGTEVFGVYLDNVKACRFINLTIKQMSAVNSSIGHCVGIRFSQCCDCLLQDSLIYGNSSDNSYIGIEWTGDALGSGLSKNITIERTRISQNYGQHILYGIKGENGAHNLINNCNIVANRNQIIDILPTDFVAGICFSGLEQASQITASEISLQFGLGRSFGIMLGLEGGSTYYPLMTIIDNNRLYNNIATVEIYGFRDYNDYYTVGTSSAYPSATILTHNIASGQGPVFKIGTTDISEDEKYMNYFGYDIQQNSVGIVNEIIVTDMNGVARPVGSPLNISYVNLDVYRLMRSPSKRVDFIRRQIGR